MKIYTRVGDDGTTGLLGGDRTRKTSVRIGAIGEIDELNSFIGVARCHSDGDPLDQMLQSIQNWLFDLGSELACPPGGKFNLRGVSSKQTLALEESIDRQTESLAPQRKFLLPGGSGLAAHLHVARSVCRRAERALLLLHQTEPVRDESRAFLNRLSDWLMVSARTANHAENVKDIEWTPSEDL